MIITKVKASFKELEKTSTLTGAALLLALGVILSFANIPVNDYLEFRFTFLAYAVTGMLFGPAVGGIVGAVCNVVAFFIKPTGFFFPGFVLNDFVYGFVFGLFFYKNKLSLKRVVASELVVTILISLILTPVWLNIMYGSLLFALPRVIKAAVMFPVNSFLMSMVLNVAQKVRADKKMCN